MMLTIIVLSDISDSSPLKSGPVRSSPVWSGLVQSGPVLLSLCGRWSFGSCSSSNHRQFWISPLWFYSEGQNLHIMLLQTSTRLYQNRSVWNRCSCGQNRSCCRVGPGTVWNCGSLFLWVWWLLTIRLWFQRVSVCCFRSRLQKHGLMFGTFLKFFVISCCLTVMSS